MNADTHGRRLTILRWILAASILSTALHFTHNFVEIDRYPGSFVSMLAFALWSMSQSRGRTRRASSATAA